MSESRFRVGQRVTVLGPRGGRTPVHGNVVEILEADPAYPREEHTYRVDVSHIEYEWYTESQLRAVEP